MAEIWKPVPSLPGVLASDDGMILLAPRHSPLPNGGYRLYAPAPCAGSSACGHSAHLGHYSRFYGNISIHRAVCEAFHGPSPFDRAVVMHIDENPTNNRPENLKWGTQKENLNAPGFKAYCRSRTGDNSPRAKFAAKQEAA